ncbi:MAG: allophanate hydrolase subunit 1 [Gammaproteobacteria bacterium]|nr:allophanate hydrolase subunit 1 [Gammaproteobacteria bacterium]
MIYETPTFSPGGDRYMLIEFGDEMNLDLNFMGQGLAAALDGGTIPGVIETAPCFATTLIHYEPEIIGYTDLKQEVSRLIDSLGPSEDIEMDSRLFYFQTLYLDPWSRECIDDYREKINPDKEQDPEFIARVNGLEDVSQFVRVHSGTEYWAASLGFWPGLAFLMPLDPRCRLTVPKYNPPRTWTPQGTLSMGGMSTAIYPVASPGGYQLFGRTPVPIWDRDRKFEEFNGELCIFRPGDRLKFMPCSMEEYEEVDRKVQEGSYKYNIVEYQRFSVRKYKEWVGKLDLSKRF